jgi:protein gp37
MSANTKIEWTDSSWNPTRGCSRVSPGCERCYAERQAIRQVHGKYQGLVRSGKNGPRWTGKGTFDTATLAAPLRWGKPRRVFVDSMSDLFFERFSDEEIAAVFGVMLVSFQHTFQVLTKRAERMRRWMEQAMMSHCILHAEQHLGTLSMPPRVDWPPANVWLGVSVENQARADERIPQLVRTPAAVRFLSVEPLLGPVDLSRWLGRFCGCGAGAPCDDWLEGRRCPLASPPPLDWIIVGGESGPGARPCAMEWIGAIIDQCREAGVPCFVKQLGSMVVSEDRKDLAGNWAWAAGLVNRKGGDMAEWPKEFQVREFPR